MFFDHSRLGGTGGCAGRKVRTPQGTTPGASRGVPGHIPERRTVSQKTYRLRRRCARVQCLEGSDAGKGEKVGQEPTAPAAMAAARKTQSGARQNRGRSGPLNRPGYVARRPASAGRGSAAAEQRNERRDAASAARTESGLQPPKSALSLDVDGGAVTRPTASCARRTSRVRANNPWQTDCRRSRSAALRRSGTRSCR